MGNTPLGGDAPLRGDTPRGGKIPRRGHTPHWDTLYDEMILKWEVTLYYDVTLNTSLNTRERTKPHIYVYHIGRHAHTLECFTRITSG